MFIIDDTIDGNGTRKRNAFYRPNLRKSNPSIPLRRVISQLRNVLVG